MDWNNDGRKDLITGENDGHIRIYLNSGTDANPVFTNFVYLQVAGTNWVGGYYSKPLVVDWNNDGKKDVLCGNSSGYLTLLLNVSTGASPLFNSVTYITNGANRLNVGSSSSPAVVDWNRDGKKDLIVGTSSGTLAYFENIGTDANPVFNGYSLLTAGGKMISPGSYSRPAVADWDNDGWPDLLVGCFEPSGSVSPGHVIYYHALSGPYLKSQTLHDGNNNGLLEPGETCSLTAVLTNSARAVGGVTATLSTTSAWCVLTVSNWTIGDFGTNRSFTNSAQPFSFAILSNTPCGTLLPLALEITGDGSAYRQRYSLSFPVAQPVFSVIDTLVNDASGNRNCACNPGETVQLLVKLSNTGTYRADAVTGELIPNTPGIAMLNSRTAFGTLERNAQAVSWRTPFAFTVPTTMPSNAFYNFTLRLSCANTSQATNLPVILGSYSVTSNTPFAWVDMSNATQVFLSDESYVGIPLGFSFPFYELRTNYVYLTSNGYLMFGTPLSSYNVAAIPNASVPNCLIAPWWEDLDPGRGGTIRYRLFGTAPDRYWVAEWLNVPRYNYPTSVRSFQVILHESGSIRFQYGTYNGAVNWRAIGIENATGMFGTAWTNAVANGMALLFSVAAGTTDSDNDGLPDAYEKFCFGSLARGGAEDTDRDGMSNLAEFCCGTDPNNPVGRLRLDNMRLLSPAQLHLAWQSVPGKPYSLWCSTNSSLSGWTRLTPVPLIGSADGTNCFTNVIAPTAGATLFRLSTP